MAASAPGWGCQGLPSAQQLARPVHALLLAWQRLQSRPVACELCPPHPRSPLNCCSLICCFPCYPVLPVTAASVVQLIEDQVEEGGCSEEATLLCQAVWQAVETGLGPTAASLPADVLPGAFLDVVLAPGRVSRRALHAALRALGGGRSVGSASLEELQQCDVQELRRALPGGCTCILFSFLNQRAPCIAGDQPWNGEFAPHIFPNPRSNYRLC